MLRVENKKFTLAAHPLRAANVKLTMDGYTAVSGVEVLSYLFSLMEHSACA